MRHYALIGSSLQHSHSKALFDEQRFADADYTLCPMPDLSSLRNWVKDADIAGFNVTNPYKQQIIPLLDEVDERASAIGAVNCVCVEDGRLIGHNTDSTAFGCTLGNLMMGRPWPEALVLGTGGAAAAVMYALGICEIKAVQVSRTPAQHPGTIGYEDARRVAGAMTAPLLVNATPVGTWSNVDESSWPWVEDIDKRWLVYDLVYNPAPTLLLSNAAARGAAVMGGADMLRMQAELSWQYWHLTE